jgi:Protein of unknown function (DUF2510)
VLPEGTTPASGRDAPQAGRWYPDPTGRNDRRYWNGRAWTDHVRRHGVEVTDPIACGYARPEQFRFDVNKTFRSRALGAPRA